MVDLQEDHLSRHLEDNPPRQTIDIETPGGGQVHIIGPSGAGKTTLAGQLGQRLGLPVYDLDHIAFTDTHWTIRRRAEKARAVEEILQQPGWIVEGGHLGWTEPLLDAADAIIWLDMPLL